MKNKSIIKIFLVDYTFITTELTWLPYIYPNSKMFSSPSPPHSLNIGCNISNNASGVTLWLVIIFLLQFIVNINFECKAIFERSKEAVWLSDNKPQINKYSHLFNKTYVHKMYHPLLWLTLMLLLCQEKMCKVFFIMMALLLSYSHSPSLKMQIFACFLTHKGIYPKHTHTVFCYSSRTQSASLKFLTSSKLLNFSFAFLE